MWFECGTSHLQNVRTCSRFGTKLHHPVSWRPSNTVRLSQASAVCLGSKIGAFRLHAAFVSPSLTQMRHSGNYVRPDDARVSTCMGYAAKHVLLTELYHRTIVRHEARPLRVAKIIPKGSDSCPRFSWEQLIAQIVFHDWINSWTTAGCALLGVVLAS